MRHKIAVTVGDINGVGPEVAIKAILSKKVYRATRSFLIAPLKVVGFYSARLNFKFHLMNDDEDFEDVIDVLNVLPMWGKDFKIEFGKVSKVSGAISYEAIEIAVGLCVDGKADAVVTAPVSKKALNLAGINYPGQTEIIAHLTGSKNFLMMFVNKKIKLGLATIHTAIKNVPFEITRSKLNEKILTLFNSLKYDFGIRSPSIALLGLNPHAGEDGLIGDEERKIFLPVIRSLKNRIKINGPFPADGFFGSGMFKKFDGVLAIYHDQGLIPVKMIDFYRTVNFSAGLKIVRTSPDHGTAFDIAGKLVADERSMLSAILLAGAISENRKKNLR